MVRLLMQMRWAQLRHTGTDRSRWAALFGLLVGLASVVGTLLLGMAEYPTAEIGTDCLSLVFVLWVSGRVAFGTFAGGDVALRPEIFRLIPVPRRRLARSLLLVGFLDPSLLLMTAAMAALVVMAGRYGVIPALVATVGVMALVALTGVLVTVVGGLVSPPNRRRRGLATAVLGVLISLVAVAGPAIPALVGRLRTGHAVPISAAVRLLPTGWAGDAVRLAQQGRPAAALPLLALVTVTAGLVLLWPTVLDRRLVEGGRRSTRYRSRRQRGPLFLGATGAALSKELHQWLRDPMRSTLLLIAAIAGLGVCLMPFLTNRTRLLLPFAGLLTLLIAGAAAGNLVGADGLSLKIVLLIPNAAHADGLGRQLAWLLIVGPYAVITTVVLTAASGQTWAWPWVMSALPAWLGGAAGLVPLASTVAVQPLDERGGLTPGWPVKIYACLVLILLTGVPALTLPLVGTLLRHGWVGWLGVLVGCGSGVTLALTLRGLGTRLLISRELDILQKLTNATSPT